MSQSRPPSFFSVVTANFQVWDANKDGTLSRDETDDLVINHKVKGNAAAALTSIHLLQNNKKIKLPPITQQYLQGMQALDGKSNQPDFQRRYVNALNKIQKTNRSLFNGTVNLDTMHQGRMGDCYLIAPLGAMVARDQNQVRKMFVQHTSTGHVIRFADGHSVKVPLLTDCEIALTATTEGHGLWLAVLEKGISLVKKDEVSDSKETDSVAGSIGRGGSTLRFIPLLTGHQGRSISFHQKDSPPKAAEVKVKVDLADVRKTLSQNLGEKRIVCCSTTTETGVPGLAPRHAYAVLKYDAVNDTVHIWNPHGNKFTPKGPPGLNFGYHTTDGKFIVPVKEFVRAFRSMTYETANAANYGQKKTPAGKK